MRVLIYDAIDRPGLLDESWVAGATFARLSGRFDLVHPAVSWESAFLWLKAAAESGLDLGDIIREVHFWGHGYPGGASIGSTFLNVGTMARGLAEPIRALRDNVDSEALFWLRTCSSFHGRPGYAFANALQNRLRCTVAGHTHKIGFPFHSGLHSLPAGVLPNWEYSEGTGRDGKVDCSGMLKPRTITLFHDRLPKGW